MTLDPRNPLGLDGFAFAEFTSPDPGAMQAQFPIKHRRRAPHHFGEPALEMPQMQPRRCNTTMFPHCTSWRRPRQVWQTRMPP